MPIAIVCPNCGRRFRVAAGHAGRRGRCPLCGGAVLVPEPDLPIFEAVDDEPGPDDYDRPRRSPAERATPQDHLPAWRRVAFGFLIQQAGAALQLLAVALILTALTILAEEPGNFDKEPTVAQSAAGSIGGLAALFGIVLQAIGRLV